MSGHTYTEYGVIVAAGPHRGTVAKTFRSLEAAQRWIDNPAPSQAGKFSISRREVAVSDWVGITS